MALRAERLAACLEGADDLHEGLVYLLYVAGADVALETDVVGNAVDGISALRDDIVDADMVLVAEGLAQRVDRVDAGDRGIKRVDAEMRSRRRVGLLALVAQHEDAEAVAAVGDGEAAPVRVVARVDHHAHIYVVEHAEADELLLAAVVDQLAALAHLGAASDLYELLSGQPEEGYGARKLLHQPGLGESRGHRVDGGNLEVVTAGVRRAGILHRERMLAADYAVELADDGDLRPLRAARHVGAEPRAREAARNVEAEPLERRRELVRGARLKKSELRVRRDIVRESLRLILNGIHRFAKQLLEFVLVHVHYPSQNVIAQYRSIIQ